MNKKLPKRPKTRLVAVRIPIPLIDRLKERACQERRLYSHVVKYALECYLDSPLPDSQSTQNIVS
jgi:hypothetical protein